MTIVSNCEEEYYPRVRPWLESVDQNVGDCQAVFVGYDWLPPHEFPNIMPVKIDADQVEALEQTYNLEHGEFLKAMPWLEDDDLIIFTNSGDLVMQRELLPREIIWLEMIPNVALGYNKRPPWDNFLIEEANRLHLLSTMETVIERFPLSDHVVCYNTGVIIGRVWFFRALAERFIQLFPLIQDTFAGAARQQFLISNIIAEMGITPVNLPPVLHAHDCYGIPSDVHWREDVLYAGEYPVVWRHKFLSAKGTK